MTRMWSPMLAIAGLGAFSLVYFAPVLADPVTRVAGGAGDPMFIGYVVTWVAEHLGAADAWNPPFLHPAPNVLAYSDHFYGLAVTIAPLVAAALPVTLIVNLIAWGAFFLTSVAIFLWLRDGGFGVSAACAGAITVTYCAWTTQQLSHPHLLFLPYLPLALLCIERVISRRAPLHVFAVAAVLLTLQTVTLASLNVFLLPAVAVYIVALLIIQRAGWRLWGAAGLMLLVVAVANLPLAAHYWSLGTSFQRSPVEIARHSATWVDWISAPAQHWLYGSRLAFTVGEERELYPGIGFAVLAIAGAMYAASARTPTRARSLSALIVAALALWAATGPSASGISVTHLPYDLLTLLMPGVRNVRVPARFVILAAIFLAPVIADAWQRLFDVIQRHLVLRPVVMALATVLVLGTVAEGVASFATYEPVTFVGAQVPSPQIKSRGVLFLPLESPAGEIRRMWNARASGVPTVNGYSGHPSYLWEAIRHLNAAPPTDEVQQLFYSRLLAAGVDTVIVEADGSPLVDGHRLQRLDDRAFRITRESTGTAPRTVALGRGAGLLVPEIGWSYPEQSETESWVWTLDRHAEFSMPMDGSGARALELRVRALRDRSPLELWWNGQLLGSRTVSTSPSVMRFDLPAEATRSGWTQFVIEGPEPIGVSNSTDPRRLSVCVYEIALR
jgi:hypothetical protein